MNQDTEASSSSSIQQFPEGTTKALASLHVNGVVNECKRLREQVESAKNLNTLIFYSRLIYTAVEAIQTMINEWSTMFPKWEVDQPKAYDYCCKKTCDVYKEMRTRFSNSILTSSTTKKTGGSKDVQKWKKQCDKNIDKIVSLIKNALLKDYSSWFDTFGFYGIYHGTFGVLSSLYQILMVKESVNDAQLKSISEVVLEDMEKSYKKRIYELRELILKGTDLVGKSNLKNSEKEEEEEEALENLQEDDLVKRFQEETTLMQKIIPDEESQKDSEREINKKLQEAETHMKFQKDEALKKLKER